MADSLPPCPNPLSDYLIGEQRGLIGIANVVEIPEGDAQCVVLDVSLKLKT